MKAIEIKNVSFKYGEGNSLPVIKGINLDIEQGEFVAILGRNGSGKSTLARLINGLLLPTNGSVKVFDMDTNDKSMVFEIRKKVGMVFQNPDNQTVATIVEDDIAFGPENIGIPPQEIGERIDFALKVTDMQDYRFSTSSKLSGGQKQRIAIAGVLAIKPNILILDEATAMLDPKGRKEVMEVVKKLNDDGMTVICITHYMEEAVNASRVIVMDGGEIRLDGTANEVFERSELITRYGLELPRAVKIANELRNKGVPISKNVMTVEDLGVELCKLLQKA